MTNQRPLFFFSTEFREVIFFSLPVVYDNEIVRNTPNALDGKSGLICLVRYCKLLLPTCIAISGYLSQWVEPKWCWLATQDHAKLVYGTHLAVLKATFIASFRPAVALQPKRSSLLFRVCFRSVTCKSPRVRHLYVIPTLTRSMFLRHKDNFTILCHYFEFHGSELGRSSGCWTSSACPAGIEHRFGWECPILVHSV